MKNAILCPFAPVAKGLRWNQKYNNSFNAPVTQWLECHPYKVEVDGSNPSGRTTLSVVQGAQSVPQRLALFKGRKASHNAWRHTKLSVPYKISI